METRLFPDEAALARGVAGLLARFLSGCGNAPTAVALPGGRSPLPGYRFLTEHPAAAAAGAFVCLTDERLVPETSPESNLGAAREAIAALGIPAERVIRVDTGLPLAEAAARYHEDLSRFFDRGGRVAAALLGLGADGHTASLFSPGDLAAGRGRFAVAIPRVPGPDRVSVTPEFLARAEEAVFLAPGAQKDTVVSKLITSPGSVTAGIAVAGVPRVSVWR